MLFKKEWISLFVALSWTFISVLSNSDESIKKYLVFDFEQKLLEKLVRLEMKMESLEHKMDKLGGSVASSVEEAERRIGKKENSIRDDWFLEKHRLLTKLDFEKEKSREIISSQFADIHNSFDNISSTVLDQSRNVSELLTKRVQNEVEMVRGNVMTAMSQLKDQLEKASTFLHSYTEESVVFKAEYLERDTNINDVTLIFVNILINKGSGYDKSTGIFTAPKSGLYLFTAQMCVESGDYVALVINAGGKAVGWLKYLNDSKEHKMCVSGDGVAILSKGDTAYVKCVQTSSSGDLLYNDGYFNSFSGVLLHLTS